VGAPGVPVCGVQEPRRATSQGRSHQRDHGPARGVANGPEQPAHQPLQRALQESHPTARQEPIRHQRDP